MGTVIKKIYVLHGWTYSLDKWKTFAKLLKKDGCELIFLKIPGLTAPSDEVWDIERYSDWLGDELNKIKGKIVLLGHSNGGRIAAYFAAKHPEKFQELILIDPAGVYHKELFLQIKRFVFGTLSSIGKKVTKSDSLKNLLYYLARERDYQKASANMKISMVNLTRTDLVPYLDEIETPTLIIWGRDDTITPLSDGRIMEKLIRGSRLVIVDGARHTPFYTHPERVWNIIKNGI